MTQIDAEQTSVGDIFADCFPCRVRLTGCSEGPLKWIVLGLIDGTDPFSRIQWSEQEPESRSRYEVVHCYFEYPRREPWRSFHATFEEALGDAIRWALGRSQSAQSAQSAKSAKSADREAAP